jgi:hypothetical protein
MVVSNLTPDENGQNPPAPVTGNKAKGKAKPILADPASLAPYRDSTDKLGQKNVQFSVPGHPKLYAHVLEMLAKDPHNMEGEDGVISIKRKSFTNAIRAAIARGFEYPFERPSELFIESQRGTAGLLSLFHSQVQLLFETVRQVTAMGGMTNEEQVKELAMQRAKNSIATHPLLSKVEITDELLEALWNGAEIDIDDEEEDEEEEETAPAPAAMPLS